MELARCKLCGQERQLRKSHIIPEFCYQTLYNEKHKFVQLSNEPGDRTITRPKGLYDRLLCDECEARMAVFENYFKALTSSNLEQSTSASHIKITGVDSANLKLFTASVIWRYYVSKFKKNDYELGPHAEKMRHMILNSDPGVWHDYGFFWLQGLSLPDSFSKSIVLPSNRRADGHRIILMAMLGLFWIVFTSRHSREHRLSEYFCRDDRLYILFDEEFTKKWFSDLAADLNNKDKLNFHF